jgi:predicted RNase H-like HicB family nuclease
MLIEWSDRDQAYLVTLPEWADRLAMPATHGDTYAEAAASGQEVIEMMLQDAMERKRPAPTPALFDTHGYATGETTEDIIRQTRQLAHEIESEDPTTASA